MLTQVQIRISEAIVPIISVAIRRLLPTILATLGWLRFRARRQACPVIENHRNGGPIFSLASRSDYSPPAWPSAWITHACDLKHESRPCAGGKGNSCRTLCALLSLYISPLTPATAASNSSGKCPEVEIVTAPMFLLEGEQNWVHSWLYARKADGKPDLDRLLDEGSFYVRAPMLDQEEYSRTLAIGLMESMCATKIGMKILSYQVKVRVAKSSQLFFPNLGDADFVIGTTVENTRLMPRLQLWSSAGLREERQILPYSGNIFESSLSKTFAGTAEEFWSRSSFWIRIISPVESPVWGIIWSKSGEFSKAVEPTTESDLSEPALITNITQEVLDVDLIDQRCTRITLSPGQSLRLEGAASTIRSPKAILVSPIRTLGDRNQFPRPFPSHVQ